MPQTRLKLTHRRRLAGQNSVSLFAPIGTQVWYSRIALDNYEDDETGKESIEKQYNCNG